MVYVASDLHGYPLEEFLRLLDKADFSDGDLLYILGDVVDRGEDGVRTLLWIMEQPNVFMILGNHEEMLLASRPLLGEVTDDMVRSISADTLAAFGRWMRNGGGVTARALNALPPEKRDEITSLLLDLPLYERVNAGGREFLLFRFFIRALTICARYATIEEKMGGSPCLITSMKNLRCLPESRLAFL